jgi:hypothetical protein
LGVVLELDDRSLSIGISEIDTNVFLALLGLNKNERMDTVLAAATKAGIKGRLSIEAVAPHTPGSFTELEPVIALSKTILAPCRELDIHLNVLVAHDQILIFRGEQHIGRIQYISESESKGSLLAASGLFEFESHHI